MAESSVDAFERLGDNHTGIPTGGNTYAHVITPSLASEQACLREDELLVILLHVEIIGIEQPVELVVVVGFRDMAFTISGWQWQSNSHTCAELDSFAKDYTAKSDCTVILDNNEEVTISLGATPSQHKYYNIPLREFVVTITFSEKGMGS